MSRLKAWEDVLLLQVVMTIVPRTLTLVMVLAQILPGRRKYIFPALIIRLLLMSSTVLRLPLTFTQHLCTTLLLRDQITRRPNTIRQVCIQLLLITPHLRDQITRRQIITHPGVITLPRRANTQLRLIQRRRTIPHLSDQITPRRITIPHHLT